MVSPLTLVSLTHVHQQDRKYTSGVLELSSVKSSRKLSTIYIYLKNLVHHLNTAASSYHMSLHIQPYFLNESHSLA